MDSVELYNNYVLYDNGTWFSKQSNKFLKPFINSSGYERVALYTPLGRKLVFTHIKIIQYFGDCFGNFLPKNHGTLRELGLSIDHKDKNKSNNNKTNLEIVTHKENCRRRDNV